MITKQEGYILGAIVGTPIAIIVLNKIYHAIYQILFPCIEDSFYCHSPMLPGFLTMFTSIALIAFAVYIAAKNKL